MNPGIMLVLLLALDMSSGICSLPRMVLLSFPGSWGRPTPHLWGWEAPQKMHWPVRATFPEEWSHNLARNGTHCP